MGKEKKRSYTWMLTFLALFLCLFALKMTGVLKGGLPRTIGFVGVFAVIAAVLFKKEKKVTPPVVFAVFLALVSLLDLRSYMGMERERAVIMNALAPEAKVAEAVIAMDGDGLAEAVKEKFNGEINRNFVDHCLKGNDFTTYQRNLLEGGYEVSVEDLFLEKRWNDRMISFTLTLAVKKDGETKKIETGGQLLLENGTGYVSGLVLSKNLKYIEV